MTELRELTPMQTTERKQTILVIDDTPDNIALMTELLEGRYRVKVANGGQRGLNVAEQVPCPDLILLDVMMPDIDGYAVCKKLKSEASTRDVPIIFLTALADHADEELGLQLGAVDYITKPFNPAIVLARINTHLQLKASSDFLRDKNEYLKAEVERRTVELQCVQDVTILTLASLAETRDNETGHHIRRTQHYVRLLAQDLRKNERYAAELDDDTIELLFKSAPLHDIGKVGIPDRILLKPGKLTPEEFEVMKTHTTLGRDAIAMAETQLGVPVEFLRYAKEIAYSHQEKWDGSGYPEGTSGEAIPLSARLMAVADVYDALRSRRVYKEPMSHEASVDIVIAGRGKHFDPAIVDAFARLAPEFQAVFSKYPDTLHPR
jgi:cyclic di-GMP phosphodiesterase